MYSVFHEWRPINSLFDFTGMFLFGISALYLLLMYISEFLGVRAL